MDLSDARARAVAKFLVTNGITAKITTIGKGWHDPLKLDNTIGLSQSDILALNRRVEWRRP
jgi:outer membrane protein OmpA-like peptidoglycan-associated protein